MTNQIWDENTKMLWGEETITDSNWCSSSNSVNERRRSPGQGFE